MLEAIFSYSRISTDEEKQSFHRQEKALEKYAADNGITYFNLRMKHPELHSIDLNLSFWMLIFSVVIQL